MGERDKPHSYRHEPSAPMKNYSLLIMGGSNGDEDGGGVDGDGSGGNSLSRQGAETETFVPRIRVFWWRRSYGTLLEKSSILLGFAPRRQYIVQRASRGGDRGGHAMPRRGPPSGRAGPWRGGCGPPPDLSFWLPESSGVLEFL